MEVSLNILAIMSHMLSQLEKQRSVLFSIIYVQERKRVRESDTWWATRTNIELVHLQNHEVSCSWPYSVTCTIKSLLEGDL